MVAVVCGVGYGGREGVVVVVMVTFGTLLIRVRHFSGGVDVRDGLVRIWGRGRGEGQGEGAGGGGGESYVC